MPCVLFVYCCCIDHTPLKVGYVLNDTLFFFLKRSRILTDDTVFPCRKKAKNKTLSHRLFETNNKINVNSEVPLGFLNIFFYSRGCVGTLVVGQQFHVERGKGKMKGCTQR